MVLTSSESPCVAAASIKRARMVSTFTIVNKVSENQSLIRCRSELRKPNVQTLEHHRSEVFLCYTHAPSEAKVLLTENINTHACGGEFYG